MVSLFKVGSNFVVLLEWNDVSVTVRPYTFSETIGDPDVSPRSLVLRCTRGNQRLVNLGALAFLLFSVVSFVTWFVEYEGLDLNYHGRCLDFYERANTGTAVSALRATAYVFLALSIAVFTVATLRLPFSYRSMVRYLIEARRFSKQETAMGLLMLVPIVTYSIEGNWFVAVFCSFVMIFALVALDAGDLCLVATTGRVPTLMCLSFHVLYAFPYICQNKLQCGAHPDRITGQDGVVGVILVLGHKVWEYLVVFLLLSWARGFATKVSQPKCPAYFGIDQNMQPDTWDRANASTITISYNQSTIVVSPTGNLPSPPPGTESLVLRCTRTNQGLVVAGSTFFLLFSLVSCAAWFTEHAGIIIARGDDCLEFLIRPNTQGAVQVLRTIAYCFLTITIIVFTVATLRLPTSYRDMARYLLFVRKLNTMETFFGLITLCPAFAYASRGDWFISVFCVFVVAFALVAAHAGDICLLAVPNRVPVLLCFSFHVLYAAPYILQTDSACVDQSAIGDELCGYFCVLASAIWEYTVPLLLLNWLKLYIKKLRRPWLPAFVELRPQMEVTGFDSRGLSEASQWRYDAF